jgi:hypothetical protein
MTWFKVDDAFPTHRKVLAIPRGQRRLAAVGAWTLAGAWVAANGNDGIVPLHVLDEFAISPRVADDLVSVGLWKVCSEGFEVHDYLHYNPSGEQIAADRKAAAERQRRAREKAMSRRDSRVTHAEVTEPSADTVTVPPTRPDPTRTKESPSDSLPVAPLPDRFDDFWSAYPRRVGRGQAIKAWKTALKKTDADTLIAAAETFAVSMRGTEPQFVPHASTWLNGERWADERPRLRAVGDTDEWFPGKGGSWDV